MDDALMQNLKRWHELKKEKDGITIKLELLRGGFINATNFSY